MDVFPVACVFKCASLSVSLSLTLILPLSLSLSPCLSNHLYIYRIGFGIARRLGLDGAKIVVSSRRQENVDRAVANLEADNIDVFGQVCHVGNPEHRSKLIEEVSLFNFFMD